MNFINDISFIDRSIMLNFYDLTKNEISIDVDGDNRCSFSRDQFKDMLILLCEIMEIER